MAITCEGREGREGHKRVIFLFKTEVYRESYQKLILKETSIILRTSLMYSTSKQLGYNKKSQPLPSGSQLAYLFYKLFSTKQ
ncbi:unknown [Bacteroides sp. CAG:443]|jgi:hypothetical protein|uniref:hypothetical protein n=1 Tax=Phocaeicola sp. TaxID=2773926 RepID=UPI0003365CD0|nr:unknown [Bacteroides sp. CAG:443]